MTSARSETARFEAIERFEAEHHDTFKVYYELHHGMPPVVGTLSSTKLEDAWRAYLALAVPDRPNDLRTCTELAVIFVLRM